jgi:hypothetical protein
MTFFGAEYAKEELLQREVLPLGMAPFIRLTVEGQEGGKPALVAEDGMFGLLPHFAAERQYGRRTYNAIGAFLTVRATQFVQNQQHRDPNDFGPANWSGDRGLVHPVRCSSAPQPRANFTHSNFKRADKVLFAAELFESLAF